MPLDVGRVTHLNDLMHRAEASNGTAIASNWITSTDGTKAVTWRPESAGGGSVSYGSNSNDVGNPSAAGASTLVSRADHVHRGVRTVTSNGSNGLFGDVNLKAGTGIALGVLGQDITLSAGSFGTLDDLTDVVITSPGLAERLRYDGTVWRNSALIWQPLTDPSVPDLIYDAGDVIMTEA